MEKKSCLLFFALLLVLLGCTKAIDPDVAGSSDKYFIRFKLDGKQMEFKVLPTFEFDQKATNRYNAVLAASNSSLDLCSIIIDEKEGFLTDRQYKATDDEYGAIEITFDMPDGNFWSSNTSKYKPEVNLVFNQITNEHVRGKFNAFVYDDNDKLGRMTDGEFFLGQK